MSLESDVKRWKAACTGNYTLALVSCTGKKRDVPAPAGELYDKSRWFRAARELAWWSDRWAILSALHGVVLPDHELAPYDCAISDLTKRERIGWGMRVDLQFAGGGLFCPHPKHVVILAGRQYAELLTPHLSKRLIPYSLPLEGLGIGQQYAELQRLNAVA